MSTNFQLLKEMKKRVLTSGACVDSLIGVPPESERFNNLCSGMRVLAISLYCRMMKPESSRICGFRRLRTANGRKQKRRRQFDVAAPHLNFLCSVA